jgi:hypothetical protein
MDFREKLQLPDFDSGLKENLFYLGLCLVLVAGLAGANNLMTDGDERIEVGYTEVFYECSGLDVGVCLGVERPQHQTYNYNEYEKPEPGTENYYRRVESELMLQAYNICEDDSLSGMDWTSEASYDNRTGDEWAEMEEVDLWGCEKTYRYQIDE